MGRGRGGVERGGGCKGVGGGDGRGKAGRGTEGGGEGEGALTPVDAGIVAGEPGEAQHQLEVCKRCKLEGKMF